MLQRFAAAAVAGLGDWVPLHQCAGAPQGKRAPLAEGVAGEAPGMLQTRGPQEEAQEKVEPWGPPYPP